MGLSKMKSKAIKNMGYVFLALFTFIFSVVLLEVNSVFVDGLMKNFLQINPVNLKNYTNWVEIIVYIINISILTALFLLFFRKENKGLKSIESRAVLKSFLYALAFGGITLICFGIVDLIPSLSEPMKTFEDTTNSMVVGSPILVFITTAILAPIEEEIIFRGIIYNAFAKVRKGAFPVIASAILFGLIHVIFVQVVYTFFMGLITALVYEKTKNLSYPILIHAFANGISVLSGFTSPYVGTFFDILSLAMILPLIVILVKGWKNKDLLSAI